MVADIIENMCKLIAQELELAFSPSSARGGTFYVFLHMNKILVTINTFIDREGRVNFMAVKTGSRLPVSWGAFKQDELMIKARAAITAKLIQLMR